jgi:hypothetical protein
MRGGCTERGGASGLGRPARRQGPEPLDRCQDRASVRADGLIVGFASERLDVGVDELVDRLVAARRILLERLQEECVDGRRQRGVHRARNRRIAPEDLRHGIGRGTRERPLTRERAVHDDRERPEIGACVDVVPGADLLGAHVEGRAEQEAWARESRVVPRVLRDAEVDELDDLVGAALGLHSRATLHHAREEHVPGLEIAMHDLQRVGEP